MSEPVNARSALRLRAALSWIALVSGVVVGVLILVLAPADDGRKPYLAVAAVCLVLAIIAATDLVVISRRRR